MIPLASALTLACRRYGLHARMSVAQLLAVWGEHPALADIANALSTDCLRGGGQSIYERCGVIWPELP